MSQTVQRAITILEFIGVTPHSPSEVAIHLDVHRSTALRLLETLTEGGLARRRPDGRYGLGYRLTGLSHLAQEQFDLPAVAHAHMVSLCQSYGHTVHLATLEGDKIIYVDKVDPAAGVRMFAEIGKPVRLHASALAKAILSNQPDDRISTLIRRCRFERLTDTTITEEATFRQELKISRDRGWAVDDGEAESFINCISVPIRDATSDVSAAMSVTALKVLADLPALEADLLPTLLEICSMISRDLGWRPEPQANIAMSSTPDGASSSEAIRSVLPQPQE
jgi:DNA-binding IclR family transcriptional regulator